jgi:hypothetical protein
MQRRLLATTLAGAAIVALAAPALAHEEITPKTFSSGQATFLTLISANESSSDVVKVALRAPAQLPFGSATRSPAGWTAAVSGTTVTWTGGAVKPGTFETFGFETEGADQPGTFTYSVTSTNGAGRNDTHEVDVTVAAPRTGTPTPAPTAGPTSTAAASPTTAAAAPSESSEGADDNSDDGSGPATAALVLSIVALLAAAAALLRGGRRPASTPAGGQSGAGSAPGAPQDW